MRELEDKLDRLARAAHDGGVQGVLLATHHNIAWLTGGRSNGSTRRREAGTARLLVTADGRRFVLANAIEMPRMLDGGACRPRLPADRISVDQRPGSGVCRRPARDSARRRTRRSAPTGRCPNTVPFEPALARTRARSDRGRDRSLPRPRTRHRPDRRRRLPPADAGDDEREIAATHRRRPRRRAGPRGRAARRIGRAHPTISASCANRDALEACRPRRDVRRTRRPDREPLANRRGRRRPARSAGRAREPRRRCSSACSTETRPGTSGATSVRRGRRRLRRGRLSDTRSCRTIREARSAIAHATGSRIRSRPQTVQARQAFAWNPDDHRDEAGRHRARPRRSDRAHHVHAGLAVHRHQPAGLRPRGGRRLAHGLKVR